MTLVLPILLKSSLLFISTAAAAAKLLQSCPTLCDPIDGSPPGSSVPGIPIMLPLFPWFGILPSNNSLCVIMCACLVSCVRLCDPMDYSPPGSSIHRIFQARILEWVAISFSWRSSQLRDQTRVSASPVLAVGPLPLRHMGRPCKPPCRPYDRLCLGLVNSDRF